MGQSKQRKQQAQKNGSVKIGSNSLLRLHALYHRALLAQEVQQQTASAYLEALRSVAEVLDVEWTPALQVDFERGELVLPSESAQ